MAVIDVRKLSYSYRAHGQLVPVLRDIDLSLGEGEWLAIQGPSGSGKSTLLYLLSGLLSLDSGEVRILGEKLSQVKEPSAFRARHIGLVFQQFHLLPRANVLDNILLPVQYLEVRPGTDPLTRARELAHSLGLNERLDHMPNQLSGGQQQRVAIARALINSPQLILADEPTGNLDSLAGEQVLEIFSELKRQGHSIIMITHDAEVAKRADRVLHLKDGKMVDEAQTLPELSLLEKKISEAPLKSLIPWRLLVKTSLTSIRRNFMRSVLTTLGVFIGVAAVCAMITLGRFTKKKVIESYATLGVNTLQFSGYPNWEQKATDLVPAQFRYFDPSGNLKPLPHIFPQIEKLSPSLFSWRAEVVFGGKKVDKEVRVVGVDHQSFSITGQKIKLGQKFHPLHITSKQPVCILGFDLARELFGQLRPVGQMIKVGMGDSSASCVVVGVLEKNPAKQEWFNPNMLVYTPYTFFQAVSSDLWDSQIKDVLVSFKSGTDVQGLSDSLKRYFEKKYGKSIFFRVNSNSLLVAQMQKFLTLFTLLLTSIALICLFIGGMGLTNMMLVSLSERVREIGLKKALGASGASIRAEFLIETTVLSVSSGLLGVLFGVGISSGAIWLAAKASGKFEFEWVLDPLSLFLSLTAIVVVAMVSGFVPALKASRLEVIEALRSE